MKDLLREIWIPLDQIDLKVREIDSYMKGIIQAINMKEEK